MAELGGERVMRRRLLVESGEEEMEKEWRLIKEIVASENDKKYEIENLNLEEILVEGIGLINISETTNSGISIVINGSGIAFFNTQKVTGASDAKYQRVHLKFNGLFWETALTPQCNNEKDYYGALGTLSSNYSVKKDVGRCKKIIFVIVSDAYPLKSGTIRIYGR
jgi:hypothetical protein